MSNNQNKCEDCGKQGELCETPACADAHTSNSSCCQKYVCKDGCDIYCSECNAVNKVTNCAGGFYFEEPCIVCKQPLSFSFRWFGDDIITACNRYCMMDCFKDKKIMTLKTKYNGDKYDTFLKEMKLFFGKRFQPRYYSILKFKTVEELNKSLDYPSTGAYYALEDTFTNCIEYIDLLNNKTKDVISELWGINL